MNATRWTVLEQAHGALRTVVAGVDEKAWTLPTPCEQWNVAQVLRHAVGDQRAYGAALTGNDGPTENPFDPSEDRPGQEQTFVESALTSTAQALAAVAPGTAEVPCPLPIGPLSAEIVVGAAALDAAIHAWDIAVATGQPSPLSAELAEQLTAAAETIAEPLRAFAFAPALDAQPSDDAAAQLLRYLGRDPKWTP
ncbi:TIGR03086 family metal-binding protein [Cryptosporangium minutisporangium]|uniref:Mycothiol-dependent maleylpyruvate isomerase metal-binding domain-containing protein n=1 Tax=Cryptosporangium minutisporangium TaxID=113569 RepID=A0ABP6T7L2_9ACTN